MVSNMEDIKTFKWISEALHEPATLQKIFFYLLFPLCLSVLSALNKGADIFLCSPHPCSPLSAPPHTFCPTTAPPPTTTPPPPPKKHWCPPCLLISVYACVCLLCVLCPAVAPVCLHASNDITGPKGEVCLEVVGCLGVAVATASSIPWEGEMEAYHSEKLLKERKKKSWGFRKQSLMGK